MKTSFHRSLGRFIAILPLLSALLHQSTSPAAAAEKEERWYILQLEGKAAGWAHETFAVSEDGKQITTGSNMKLAMKRDDTRIEMTMRNTTVETADGKPVSYSSETLFGSQKISQTYTFKGDKIEIVTLQAGQKLQSLVDLPKESWLTPAASGRYVKEQIKAGARTIKMRTFEPSSGLTPVEIEMNLQGREDVEVLGKTVPAILCHATMSSLPGVVSKQHIGEDGTIYRMTMEPIPGFGITMLLADKDLATAQVDPPELLASTLIEMKEPIKNPRKLKSAVYELRFKPAAAGAQGAPGARGAQEVQEAQGAAKAPQVEIPKTGFQKVVWGDDRTAKVIVDLTEPVAPGNDLPGKEHRAASASINSDDPKVKELVEKALKGQPADLPAKKKADVLRKFVHRYISKKDLSVGFATASEVARTRQGDCTEHGVLLAAMLRAAGIPSRTVSGLIYADEFISKKHIFAYHMWAQAWIEPGKDEKPGANAGGYWMDFDGTLDDWPYDAAHIILGVSAMADDEKVNDMVQLVQIIGKLELKVISTQAGQ